VSTVDEFDIIDDNIIYIMSIFLYIFLIIYFTF
jgi:hypothetical protein